MLLYDKLKPDECIIKLTRRISTDNISVHIIATMLVIMNYLVCTVTTGLPALMSGLTLQTW